jgi:hypothetical protein
VNFSGAFSGITLGNGDGDTVNGDGGRVGFILGDGDGDTVNVDSFLSLVRIGNGDRDTVNVSGSEDTITLGNGDRDTVIASSYSDSVITVGNGNGDVVNDSGGSENVITAGNGNDRIDVGSNDRITVGTGRDSFVFQQTTPGTVGAVAVTGFEPNKDSFTFSTQLTTSVSYHDNAQGNAVVTVDNAGDTITLVGVHSADLHPSDFHFVDPAALPTLPSTAQMVADLHAHGLLV